MINYLWHIFIPLILSNIIHMLIIKQGWLSSLCKPVSVSCFGPNKTWRGFIIVIILNGIFFGVVNVVLPKFGTLEALRYGVLLGLAYMVFELPNSMLKRYMGIAAGERSQKNPVFYSILDKSDSALGVSLISKLIFGFTWVEIGLLFFGSVAIHSFFSLLLVVIGVKRSF